MAVNAIKPPVIPRLRGGVKGGVAHAVAALITELHARRRAVHRLSSHQLVINLIATSIMTGSQIHPALACTHMMTTNLGTVMTLMMMMRKVVMATATMLPQV